MEDIQQKIMSLKRQGKQNPGIIEDLKKSGYSSQEIYDAMSSQQRNPDSELRPPTPSQEIGSFNESEEIEETEQNSTSDFMPSQKFPAPQNITGRQQIEDIEEIAESIINEKMDELNISLGEMTIWKERVSTEIDAIKQEILRVRNSFENLQTAMVGRVEDYRKNINDMSIEIKALNKIMEKIIEPLSENVKELSRITERLKK